MQSVVQAFVLVTLPVTQTHRRNTCSRGQFKVKLSARRIRPEVLLPVHAPQGQINVRILEQHPGEEVLYGRINQEWCVYDLQTFTQTRIFTRSGTQCC